MCLSKAWFVEKSGDAPIMEDIAKIQIEDEKVTLLSLFGEATEVNARLKSVDFTSNKVFLEEVRS